MGITLYNSGRPDHRERAVLVAVGGQDSVGPIPNKSQEERALKTALFGINSCAMKLPLVSILVALLVVGCKTTDKESIQAPEVESPEVQSTDVQSPNGQEPKTETPRVKVPRIPIHEAFKFGNLKAVKQHLAAGTDVNGKGPNAGLTPLHRAVYYGLKEIVEIILTKNANVNATEEAGWTPLHYAAAMNQKEIAELLIAHGADVNAKDVSGEKPLLAKMTGEDESKHLGGKDKILKKSPVDLAPSIQRHGYRLPLSGMQTFR